jgi:hypothetical protein
MNTTNVFVELLVIGFGPLTALILFVLIAMDPAGVSLADVLATGSSLALIVPMLATTISSGSSSPVSRTRSSGPMDRRSCARSTSTPMTNTTRRGA